MAENKDTEELLAVVSLGIEAESFINSNLGRYLVKRAEEERDHAFSELKNHDPDDATGIRRLQNKIWRAENIQFWIAEVIQEGFNAEAALQQQENTD